MRGRRAFLIAPVTAFAAADDVPHLDYAGI
jgi:hypothetical protein